MFDATTTGITPDPAGLLNMVWGDGKAKLIDAVEGLYPAPVGDLNCSGGVDIRDVMILNSHWRENACD